MILYGASGHAKVIIEILEKQGIPVSFLVDTNPEIKEVIGYKVFTSQKEAGTAPDDEIIIAIGNNAVRKKLAGNIMQNFGRGIHPSAIISARSSIGAGTVVMAGAIVNSAASVGEHVILNTGCVVDHDCILGDFVHISPNAALAGDVAVGEGTHVGIGASVIQGCKIGKWCTIGAGAVVIRDVPDYAVVVGNPGRVIKYNTIT